MTIRVATRAFNLYTTSAVYRVPETWNKWSARAEHHPVRNKSRDAYIVIFPISPPTEERGVPLRQSSAITGNRRGYILEYFLHDSTALRMWIWGRPRKRKVAKGGGKPKLRSINETGELRSKRVFGIQARFVLTAAVECRMFIFIVVWIEPNLVPFT